MTILDDALRYRAEGLVVIPVHARVKGPAIDNWQIEGAQTEERVRELFAGRDGANIGIVCGAASRLVVVDVDTKWGKAGATSLAAWQAEHGALPPTRTHRTPSDGVHLLFRLPEGRRVKSSHRVMGPDIDVQGERAQILAPPSVLVGELGSGGRPQVPGAYSIFFDDPIADCPAALLERLDAPAVLAPCAALEWTPVAPSDDTFAERVALQRERFDIEPLHLEGEGAGNIRYVMLFQRLGAGLLLDAEITLRSYVERYEPRLPEAHRWLPACRDELLHTLGRSYTAPMANGHAPDQTWREHLMLKEILSRPPEVLTAADIAALRAAVALEPRDAARTELGNVLAAVGMLGVRLEDGSREATCPRGHVAAINHRGRFRCSDRTCGMRTKADIFRTLLESSWQRTT